MGMTTPVAYRLSCLIYSYKYGNKKQYFDALEWLKEVLDEDLYTFFYCFGCSTLWKGDR